MKCVALLVLMCMVPKVLCAQDMEETKEHPVLSELRIQIRGEFDYLRPDASSGDEVGYGFCGRYFMLRAGGDLGERFSYYLRQRVIARPGSASLFDNTDFLYLDFHASQRLTLRVGKDAMAIGGYEYDADPVDVYYNGYYWDIIECFQLAAAATWRFSDSHKLMLQVSNSPWVSAALGTDEYGKEYRRGLLSYNVLWAGDFGPLHTLYSVNMMERRRGCFMNMIALGQRLEYDRWNLYVDLMHHSLATDDWGRNYGIVTRAAYQLCGGLSLFAKGGYETNRSKDEIPYNIYATTGALKDILSRPETDHLFYGLGAEYMPRCCDDVRLHAFICWHDETHPDLSNVSERVTLRELNANIGVTWQVDAGEKLRKLIGQ